MVLIDTFCSKKTLLAYLDFLVSLLTQITASAGHLGAAHREFLGCEMLLCLYFCNCVSLDSSDECGLLAVGELHQ